MEVYTLQTPDGKTITTSGYTESEANRLLLTLYRLKKGGA